MQLAVEVTGRKRHLGMILNPGNEESSDYTDNY
jgi:hypothetical protein